MAAFLVERTVRLRVHLRKPAARNAGAEAADGEQRGTRDERRIREQQDILCKFIGEPSRAVHKVASSVLHRCNPHFR